ncbi:hypothetical protein STEG23_032471, partial [Scotinomys teguina]
PCTGRVHCNQFCHIQPQKSHVSYLTPPSPGFKGQRQRQEKPWKFPGKAQYHREQEMLSKTRKDWEEYKEDTTKKIGRVQKKETDKDGDVERQRQKRRELSLPAHSHADIGRAALVVDGSGSRALQRIKEH